MKYAGFLLLFVSLFASKTLSAHAKPVTIPFASQTLRTDSVLLVKADFPGDTSRLRGENKKLIAALLAFPVPFGVLGLHRIYLGTAPWVPVAYVVTLGGFGMLSLVDFVYIVFCSDEELEAISHNPKLFFWVK